MRSSSTLMISNTQPRTTQERKGVLSSSKPHLDTPIHPTNSSNTQPVSRPTRTCASKLVAPPQQQQQLTGWVQQHLPGDVAASKLHTTPKRPLQAQSGSATAACDRCQPRPRPVQHTGGSSSRHILNGRLTSMLHLDCHSLVWRAANCVSHRRQHTPLHLRSNHTTHLCRCARRLCPRPCHRRRAPAHPRRLPSGHHHAPLAPSGHGHLHTRKSRR